MDAISLESILKLDFKPEREVINNQCWTNIFIETERLLKLKDKENFGAKVTEIFVQKERRMDFIYK